METLKYGTFQFVNYYRIYTYLVKPDLDLKEGLAYHIETATDSYHTPVIFCGYVDHGPKDVQLKTIVLAEEM